MHSIYEDIRTRFDSYVRGFYSEDEFLRKNIVLKEEHTRRVVEETEALADHLALDPRQKTVVSVIALLHDIARFPQITLYRSFRDRETRDHGDWGHDIILQQGLLDGLPEEERKPVLTAVRLHNKFVLPEDLEDETRLYCHVIRDADKIDIFRVVTSTNVTEEGIVKDPQSAADTEYNPFLVENILSNTNADYRHVSSQPDMYLLQLSWVYSLNFSYTREQVSKRGYIEALLAKLPEDDSINAVRDHVRTFLARSLQRTR